MDFKDAVRKKEQEKESSEVTHRQINAAILNELPKLYENAVSYFKDLSSDTPIIISAEPQTKQLVWAYNREKIGTIQVSDYVFSFNEKIMSISLNPVMGYIGATAKIDLTTSVLRELPIINGGLFLVAAYESDQKNAIKYMDSHNKVHEFNAGVAEQIMRIIFLDERVYEQDVERWG